MINASKLYTLGVSMLPVNVDKSPGIVGGKQIGVTSATRDLNAIGAWLNSGFGLGVAGGKLADSDRYLVIMDIDVKKEDGKQTIANLETEYGELPETFSIKSPSGGRHLYFTCERLIGSYNDAFHRTVGGNSGVDIKGHHGYAVGVQDGYEVEQDVPPQALPERWVLLLLSLIAQREKVSQETLQTFTQPPQADVVKRFNDGCTIQEALEHWGYTKTGTRTYCHPDGATSTQNVTVIANTSLFKYGAKEVSFHWGAHDHVTGGPHDAADIFRLRQFGGDWDATLKWMEEGFANEDGEHDCKFGGTVYGVLNYIKRQPPRLALIEDHFRQQDVVIISGQSETFKTFAAMAMCFSGATGIPYLGEFPVRQFKSVMVLTESRHDFRDRLTAWVRFYAQQFHKTEKELLDAIHNSVFLYFKPLYLDDRQSREHFERFKERYAQGFTADVWVLDHFSSNYNGSSENDNIEVAKFLNVLRQKAQDEDAAIIMLHHPSKGGEKRRGATVLHNNIPVSFNFTRERDADDLSRGATRVVKDKTNEGFVLKPYNLQGHIFDLYPDEGSITPRMRTGLTVSYKQADIPLLETVTHEEQDEFETMTTEGKILFYLKKSEQQQSVKSILQTVDVATGTLSSALKKLEDNGRIRKNKVKGKNKYLYSFVKENTDE